MKPDEQNPALAEIEQCLTVNEISKKWTMSEDAVRRVFIDEPGTLRFGTPTLLKGRQYKRRYFSLRIPISVFRRVDARLKAPRPNQAPRSPKPRQRPARKPRQRRRAG